ncbi:MAG: hypothetical protein ABGY42_14625 [bacterium]|jgi:uncharacterized membrane protein
MRRFKTPLLYLLSFQLCLTGFLHLLSPEFFVAIVPPGLPNPEWLNVISGLAEIVLGVYLLEPRTRVLAAWGVIALLIAVFPANVNMALTDLGPDGPGTGSAAVNYGRLPFQLLFAVWAWWYTRPDDTA